jgi:hypothetical protein
MKKKELIKKIEKVFDEELYEYLKELEEKGNYEKVLAGLVRNTISNGLSKYDIDSIIYEYTQVVNENSGDLNKEIENTIFALLTAKERIIEEIEG